MACGSLWLQVVVVVAYAAAVSSLRAADKILVDTEGWHGRVIGLRTGSPSAPLPHGRLPHMGNWLLLLLLLLLFSSSCPLPTDERLSLSLVFFSFSLALSCSSQLRWNWKFVGLKFEMVLLNILYTLLGVWKSWGNVGNKAAGEDDVVKRKYFHSQPLASKYESSVWGWKDIIWLPFKPVEVLLKCQLCSARLVTFYFSVLSLL